MAPDFHLCFAAVGLALLLTGAALARLKDDRRCLSPRLLAALSLRALSRRLGPRRTS